MRILTRGAVAAAAVLVLSSAAAGQSTTQAGQQWTAAFNPVPFGHLEALEVYRCAY